MKLISRKAAIAAITAAAVTAGTMTAPAMADKKPANPPASTSQSAAPSSSSRLFQCSSWILRAFLRFL